MNVLIIHTTGGGLILMDEDPILDNERQDENISPHSTKPSEVATATMKGGSECLSSHDMREQQYSQLSTDQCQVDLDPVVVMDKDLFHGGTLREEDAPPLRPSTMADAAAM